MGADGSFDQERSTARIATKNSVPNPIKPGWAEKSARLRALVGAEVDLHDLVGHLDDCRLFGSAEIVD